MAVSATPTRMNSSNGPSGGGSGPTSEAVLDELQRVLGSDPFRNSARSREFLSFVVRHKLDGRDELLKERTIGSELFHRKADYSTGDDAIVRVHAGDVRKRLDHYYQANPNFLSVRIDLPVGSYIPEFRAPVPAAVPVEAPRKRFRPRLFIVSAAIIAVAVVVLGLALRSPHPLARSSVLSQFWAPALSSTQPVLICMSKPVLYRPSLQLYQDYSKAHPGTFQSEVERMNQALPLDPNQQVAWKDMVVYSEFGVAAGDAYAAFRIAALLGKMEKPTQFRIGNESSFEDLRNEPAVIIGGFSNRWTLEMTSNLRFAFNEKDAQFWIEDHNSPGKRWFTRFDAREATIEDFGIANRLLDSKTGQLVISVAGIRAAGSDAAAQLISNEGYLENALRSAPADWQHKNVQFVVKTEVVDSVAGPPQIVAAHYW
jgi:hypothetical protein